MGVKIRSLKEAAEPDHIGVTATMTFDEYAALQGHLDDFRVFPSRLITEPATTIKTGVCRSYTKYFLFPVNLRRRWRTDQCDFGKLQCGILARA